MIERTLFNADHESFRDSFRRFVDKEVIPNAQELEHSDSYPQDIVDQMREMGLFGLMIFAFLVMRAYTASFAALRMLRMTHRRSARDGVRGSPAPAPEEPYNLSAEDRRILDINAKGMIAAMVGWTICAFFASVAFNWTFYYVFALAVAGREILRARRVTAEAPVTRRAGAARLVRATA